MNHQLLTTSYLYILLLLLSINLAASSQEEPAKDGIQSTINFEALKNAPKPKERIVGGKTARPGAYPFFAQWMKGCGGSLIHDDIVLTAGHCLTSEKDFQYDIFVGGHKSATGYQRKIIDYVRHPRYSFKEDKAYDFLLLKLDRPIPDPLLVTLNQNPNYPFTDEMFTVIGFGFTREDGSRTSQYLQEVEVPHIPDCTPYYRKSSVQSHIAFCAGHEEGGRDSCQADSGGALLNPQTGVQIGLVSWGRGCARRNSPGVYARVSTVYGWIQHQICELSDVPPAHCTQIRLDVTMDDFPFETEWALLDEYGHEMVVSRRGQVRKTGLTSIVLNVPSGKYRFYMSDEDGICCSHGQGGIAIYSGSTTNNKLLEHDGRFQQEVVLPFILGNRSSNVVIAKPNNPAPSQGWNTPATSVPSNTNNVVTVYDEVTAPGSALNFGNPNGGNDPIDTAIPPPPPPPPPPATVSPWVSQVPSNPAVGVGQLSNIPVVEEVTVVVGSTLRIEIFYDMHPQETGWFLVNTDTYEEVYTSKYDKNRRIPSNAGNELSLVVEEFEGLDPGPYWFVIADSSMNGICCDYGQGSVRIVQLKWTSTTSEAQRDHSDVTSVEEHVLWQHNGKFSAFAEVHFEL